MRNLLALAALAVLVFLGLGWYLGWYKIQSTAASDGHRHISIDLNTNKITDDVNKGKAKVRDLLAPDNNNTQNVGTPTTPTTATNFRPEGDGSIVFPSFNPTPPSSGPTLPTPK